MGGRAEGQQGLKDSIRESRTSGLKDLMGSRDYESGFLREEVGKIRVWSMSGPDGSRLRRVSVVTNGVVVAQGMIVKVAEAEQGA